MKNTNLESSDKSASQATETHSDSPLVAEAWSRSNSPTSRLADNNGNGSNNAGSQFLDMGSADMLYGKAATEPDSAAVKHDKEVRHSKHDQKPDQKHDQNHDQHETAKPVKTADKKSPVEQKSTGTEPSTTKETAAPKAEAEIPTSQPARTHPDRLEEIGKTRPEVVARFHESEKNFEHKKLNDWADKTLQDPDRSAFKKDMSQFEERAKRDGLAPADVTVTYKEIERLTGATGEKPLTTRERNIIAQQVLRQAAVPTSIDQGQHGTCTVASVEARAYTRTPAAAARLVADVALNGEYRSNDGTVVKQDPKAHHESLQVPTADGKRSHASEIFQVTAVNLHYVKYNAQHGTNIRYEQVDPVVGDKADRGERLTDYSVPGGKEICDANGPIRYPYLADGDLTEISNSISSRSLEQDVSLVSDQYLYGDKDKVSLIHSKEELAAKLNYVKEHNQLPIILRVNTTAEPFYTDSGQGTAGGSGGAHFVTVTDYDEKTGLATVDNQWGKGNDHGKDKPIQIQDLFTSMQTNLGIEEQLRSEVKLNRENSKIDTAKEMQMLRLQKLNGSGSDADYATELQTVIADTHKSWQSGKVSEAQKISDVQQLDRLIHNGTPASDQISLLRKERQLGMISYEDYRTQLTFAGVKSEKDFKDLTKQTAGPEMEYCKSIEALSTALADLTPQDQKWVSENIQTMSK